MRVFLLIAFLISPLTFADTTAVDPIQADAREERVTPPLRNKIYRALSKAQNEMGKNKLDKAEKRLKKLLDKGDANRYELANIHNRLAYIHYRRKNYPAALESYEGVIEQSPDIPWALEKSTRYTSGMLSMLTKDYGKSIRHFERYLEMHGEPDPRVDRMYLEAYLGLKRFDEGEVFLNRHLEHLSQEDEEPSERLLEIIAEYNDRR